VLRIGIDLVEVADVRSAVTSFGDRYKTRVLSTPELDCCDAAPHPSRSVAERLAAKEATIKVMGQVESGLDWRSIEVHVGPAAKPAVRLSGTAAEIARAAGVTDIQIATSIGAGHAVALVLADAERRQ